MDREKIDLFNSQNEALFQQLIDQGKGFGRAKSLSVWAGISVTDDLNFNDVSENESSENGVFSKKNRMVVDNVKYEQREASDTIQGQEGVDTCEEMKETQPSDQYQEHSEHTSKDNQTVGRRKKDKWKDSKKLKFDRATLEDRHKLCELLENNPIETKYSILGNRPSQENLIVRVVDTFDKRNKGKKTSTSENATNEGTPRIDTKNLSSHRSLKWIVRKFKIDMIKENYVARGDFEKELLYNGITYLCFCELSEHEYSFQDFLCF